MKVDLQPTPRTAAVAGAWAVFGMVPFEMWITAHQPTSIWVSNILWLVAAILFLFIPGYLLVLGRHKPFSPSWFVDPAERTRYGVVVKRMLAWLVSAGGFGSVWSLFLSNVFS
jgi:hypothetical protein